MNATTSTRVRQVCNDDGGMSEAIGVMMLATVVMAVVMLLTLAGRSAETRSRLDHAAESAAQAAARQRTPAAAIGAATTTAQPLTGACTGTPDVDVDVTGWGPGGVVTVEIRCAIPTGDLAPLPLPGSLTMVGRSSAVIDTYRTR